MILPTCDRRRALAGALWRTARWIRREVPHGKAHVAYLIRVQLLRMPGEFDFDAYDRAAGRQHAFFRDWQTHETQALRLFRALPPEVTRGSESSPLRQDRGRLRVVSGGST